MALSVLLHGPTAWWGSNVYADFVATHPQGDELAERREPIEAVRVPLRSRHHPQRRAEANT